MHCQACRDNFADFLLCPRKWRTITWNRLCSTPNACSISFHTDSCHAVNLYFKLVRGIWIPLTNLEWGVDPVDEYKRPVNDISIDFVWSISGILFPLWDCSIHQGFQQWQKIKNIQIIQGHSCISSLGRFNLSKWVSSNHQVLQSSPFGCKKALRF